MDKGEQGGSSTPQNDLFIIGGGASLKGFSFSRLKDQGVICCNRGFEFMPWSYACVFYDSSFYKHYRKDLLNYGGWKVTLKGHTGKDKWHHKIVEYDASINDHVNNSGHLALAFALTLNPRRVFLLGFDMTSDVSEDMNYYTYPQDFPRHSFESYVEKFDMFRGQPVYNCTPGSALTQFEFIDIDTLV